MPDIFILIHPVGTVLGNANYSDYLVVYQNVTVNTNGIHPPTLGKFVTLGAGASILGECVIGDRVGIGATVTMRNKRVSDNSVVYRDEMGKIHFRHKDKSFAENCFVEK